MREEVNRWTKGLWAGMVMAGIMLLHVLAPMSWAQETLRTDEVVVTATRLAEPKEESTSPVEVVTEEDIKRMGADFLPEVIRKATGTNLIQYGGPGASASVQLRGGGAEHVVVMIDGVKVKSTTLGYYDLAGLTVDDIARIEIVRGPQSTMYGSEAVTGVINIITKKGKPGFGVGGSYEIGSFGTKDYGAFASMGGQTWNLRVSASRYKTDGISAYKDGDEEDAYENTSYAASLGMVLAKNMTVEVSHRSYEDDSDLDFGTTVDDPNYHIEGEHTVSSAKVTALMSGTWEQMLLVSRAEDSIKSEDPDDTLGYYSSEIDTSMETVDWQHNFYLAEGYTLTLGAERREEKGENNGAFEEQVVNKALYFNTKRKNDRVTFNIGARYDDHETFGEQYTYRVGVVEQVSPVARFRASYGTGFRAPTLNQLYWPGAGNADLDPEKSKSWEIGIEQDLGENTLFSLTYFEQKYEDLIDWVFDGTYHPANVARAKVKGVETSLEYRGQAWDVRASHTHLETEDADGKRLARRPKDKYFFSLGYHGEVFSASADYTYVGMRYNQDGEAQPLDAYQLVNLSTAFQITKMLRIYARGENVLDEDYTLAKDWAGREYGATGEAYYAGIKLEF